MKSKFLKIKFVILNTTISKKKTYDFGIKLEDWPRHVAMPDKQTKNKCLQVITQIMPPKNSKSTAYLNELPAGLQSLEMCSLKILLLSCIFFRLCSFYNVKEKSADHCLIFLLYQHTKRHNDKFLTLLNYFLHDIQDLILPEKLILEGVFSQVVYGMSGMVCFKSVKIF